MGLRFRKSINFGPVRVNLSKSGIGYSVGKKGMRVTRTASGRTQATVSVPGTGISYVQDLGGSKGKKKRKKADKREVSGVGKWIGILLLVVVVAAVLIWCKL